MRERQAAGVEAAPPLLAIHELSKSYGGTPALRGVSLAIPAGAIVCLLGPSGCGKSTLLRLVAGLERPDDGDIRLGGRSILGAPPHERGFGLMFQEYALFPHLDVAANVAFGLRVRGEARAAAAARVAELLELVGLAGYERRRVYELSGGERQRVALARSLAPSPRLLMLDEPLGALDRALRERLLDELHGVLRRVGVTSIYVTHDQDEAFAIGDELVLMNAGQIEQHGPPEQVYRAPATLFAARFLGFTNLVPATARGPDGDGALFDTPLGLLRAHRPANHLASGQAVTLVIRPEAARVAPIEPGQPGAVRGTLAARSFRGGRARVALRHASGRELTFDLDNTGLPPIGAELTLSLRPDALSVIASPDTA